MFRRCLVLLLLQSTLLLASETEFDESIIEEQDASLYLQLVQQAEIDEVSIKKAKQILTDVQELEVITDLKVSPFHKRAQEPLTDEQIKSSQGFCQVCHSKWPHQKQVRSRAMLNKHTAKIACETCHLRPNNKTLSYAWLDYKAQSLVAASAKKDTGVRIAPFYNTQPAIIFPGHPFVQKTLKQWKDELSIDEDAKTYATIHAPLTKNKTSCKSCHQSKLPLLDLKSLGMNDDQVKTIEHNLIANFFGRYKNDNEQIRILELLR